MTKRVLFGRNPLDEPARERMCRENAEYLKPFTHRIPMKRRDLTGATHWDRFWRMSVDEAVRELDIEAVRINDGLFTRSAADRDAVFSRAEVLWRSKRPGAV